MTVKELFKSSFEIWCKTRWLKMIDKDLDKAKYLESKASHKRLVAKLMLEEYEKRYGNDTH